jgi:bifunctional non-homologous end joining protein LigD
VDVAPVLLPHIADRAMVMKRYPHGADGPFFFMKRAPVPRPSWIRTCAISHDSGNVIDFPVIDDVPSLMWVINLGCIDLNQWYAKCDDVDTPDYVHFDLDPGEGATFGQVLEAALIVREALETLKMRPLVKTSGSKGLHLYVPIVRGPVQKTVWTFAKALSVELASRHPRLMTSEYRVAKRPRGRVLVDYNQNAWGRTLASIYSVRPRPRASVSTPITWDEVAAGVQIDDFRLDNVRERLRNVGDLWKPLLAARRRADLGRFMKAPGVTTPRGVRRRT